MPRTHSDNRAGKRRTEELMSVALAATAGTFPHPNPRVGAVLVAGDGSLVTTAAHLVAGGPHAERIVLDSAGPSAAGGTLFVTLEPCSHHGRTPPCVDAIIEAGVAKVVVGASDPDARVDGRGLATLTDAGIDVRSGVMADEVRAADPGYFHHRRTGRTLVTVKLAATLDGQVAALDGSSQWITSLEARQDVHRMRSESDVVIVGAGTVRADDPRLTVRLDGFDGPQPRPVVVAGKHHLARDAAVLRSRNPLIYAPESLDLGGVEVVAMGGRDGVDLTAMMKDLASRSMLSALVEGGPTLAKAMLAEGLVDRMVIYYGALLAGGQGRPMFADTFATLGEASKVSIVDVRRLGADLRVVVDVAGGDG